MIGDVTALRFPLSGGCSWLCKLHFAAAPGSNSVVRLIDWSAGNLQVPDFPRFWWLAAKRAITSVYATATFDGFIFAPKEWALLFVEMNFYGTRTDCYDGFWLLRVFFMPCSDWIACSKRIPSELFWSFSNFESVSLTNICIGREVYLDVQHFSYLKCWKRPLSYSSNDLNGLVMTLLSIYFIKKCLGRPSVTNVQYIISRKVINIH